MFENKRETSYDIDTVAPFRIVRPMNQRRILNQVKHLLRTKERLSRNSLWLQAVIYFCKKNSIVDVWLGSKYASVKITLHVTFLRKILMMKFDESS